MVDIGYWRGGQDVEGIIACMSSFVRKTGHKYAYFHGECSVRDNKTFRDVANRYGHFSILRRKNHRRNNLRNIFLVRNIVQFNQIAYVSELH